MSGALGLVALVAALGCEAEVSLGRADAGADGSADGAIADVGADASCSAPDASACGACVATACCDLRAACALTPTCPCIVACVEAGDGDAAACSTHCGADGGEHALLLTCAHDLCAAACP